MECRSRLAEICLPLQPYISCMVVSDLLDLSVNMIDHSIILFIRFSIQSFLLGITTSKGLLKWYIFLILLVSCWASHAKKCCSGLTIVLLSVCAVLSWCAGGFRWLQCSWRGLHLPCYSKTSYIFTLPRVFLYTCIFVLVHHTNDAYVIIGTIILVYIQCKPPR